MKKFFWSLFLSLLTVAIARAAGDPLAAGFSNPPTEARLRAYWWWLNGNVTAQSITRDLEEMKAKGFGGALICDAGGAEQRRNDPVPHGPDFLSPSWRQLYRHALTESARLGLELSLNLQSGWNLGGPIVTADDASKKLTWSESDVQGPGSEKLALPAPPTNDGYYRDVVVLAWPVDKTPPAPRRPLKNYKAKALIARPVFEGPNGWMLGNSSPETAPILGVEEPEVAGEADAGADQVINLTAKLADDGTLTWNAPAGRWHLLRLGSTLSENRFVSTSSEGWKGYAIDVLDRRAFQHYWDAVVEPLVADAGPLAGKTLRYLHTDSWEVDVFNWTPTALEAFQARRGYDPRPWLPVIAGRIIGSRAESNRFLADYRRTLGDLAVDNHYKLFKELAARHGMGIHAESGGPHFTPIDSQQCLAIDDVPMAEFWAEAPSHRTIDSTKFFVKQPASAAHTAGHRIVAAEGFTNIGLHWQERLWENLKPSFDQACVEGLNRLVWHAFVCSPEDTGVPGQQYFAGTHLNPKVTWWEKSAPFFTYLNRCQFMLQRGLPVSDVLYYYGNDVPNYTQLRARDPAGVGPGYDYDVIALDQLLERVAVREGRLVLPEGTSYCLLALPDSPVIAPAALKKIRELVLAGATVIGPRPERAAGLAGFPQSDAEVHRVADEIWSRVKTGRTARDALREAGFEPDFEFAAAAENPAATLNYIHRRDGDTEIYFVANRAKRTVSGRLTFRVAEKAPELWDAVTGSMYFATNYASADGRTVVPLELPPCGSIFVIFRSSAAGHASTGASNTPCFAPSTTLVGKWRVSFDPKWGGPVEAEFAELADWTKHREEGIRYYSGTAVYRKTFNAPADATVLDLGDVRELASVRLNGESLGIVWAPPFRLNIAGRLKPADNELEIEVVNFWANRVIGDEALPANERRTQTNIRNLKSDSPLMASGLLGPVRLLNPVTSP